MMHNPPHPGEFIREVCLEPLGLTVAQAAEHLGVSRKALSELLNGHSGISPVMALRLSMAFGGTTAESWLTQQMHYDLFQEKKKKLKVLPLWKKSRITKKPSKLSIAA
jgi:addiction module HigA family antidote